MAIKNTIKKQPIIGFWGKWDQSHNFPEIAGQQIRAYFDFKTEEGEKIKIKFALSPVSTDTALANLRIETPSWDFEAVKQAGAGTLAKRAEQNNHRG